MGLLRCGRSDFLRRRSDDGSVLGRRLGLGLRLGRQQRLHQPQQQFQSEYEYRRWSWRRRRRRWCRRRRRCGWCRRRGRMSAARVASVASAASGITGPPDFLPVGRSNWSHNPQHRGGAPYRDRATADRFGGSARGDSLAQRQAGARQQISRQGGNLASKSSVGGFGNRAGGGNAATAREEPAPAIERADRVLAATRTGGADRIGSRDLSRSGGGDRDAFGGGSRGFSGSSARSSSSRGSSSLGSRGGGGGGRGGGGRRR